MPSGRLVMAFTGQTGRQAGSSQCLQATETLRSRGVPSSNVTTLRRESPGATPWPALQAMTQPRQEIHLPSSQIWIIWVMARSLCLADPAEAGLRLLHL